MEKNIFTLPAPLSHYRAIVGSAHVVPDAWGRFGVMLTLENSQRFCIQDFSNKSDADNLVAELNRCTAD